MGKVIEENPPEAREILETTHALVTQSHKGALNQLPMTYAQVRENKRRSLEIVKSECSKASLKNQPSFCGVGGAPLLSWFDQAEAVVQGLMDRERAYSDPKLNLPQFGEMLRFFEPL